MWCCVCCFSVELGKEVQPVLRWAVLVRGSQITKVRAHVPGEVAQLCTKTTPVRAEGLTGSISLAPESRYSEAKHRPKKPSRWYVRPDQGNGSLYTAAVSLWGALLCEQVQSVGLGTSLLRSRRKALRPPGSLWAGRAQVQPAGKYAVAATGQARSRCWVQGLW